jgi:hypothetical protein
VRRADSSVPHLDFMRLSTMSKFVDDGTNVMLPYAGTAPDLGCDETGLPLAELVLSIEATAAIAMQYPWRCRTAEVDLQELDGVTVVVVCPVAEASERER